MVERLAEPEDKVERMIATFVHAFPGHSWTVLCDEFRLSMASTIDAVHGLVTDGYIVREGSRLFPTLDFEP